MGPSFARTGDDEILEHVRAIDGIGATVTLTTTEGAGTSEVTRRVVIEWQTHSVDSRVLR